MRKYYHVHIQVTVSSDHTRFYHLKIVLPCVIWKLVLSVQVCVRGFPNSVLCIV